MSAQNLSAKLQQSGFDHSTFWSTKCWRFHRNLASFWGQLAACIRYTQTATVHQTYIIGSARKIRVFNMISALGFISVVFWSFCPVRQGPPNYSPQGKSGPRTRFINNDRNDFCETFMELLQCNISRNNHITWDVRPSSCCVIPHVALREPSLENPAVRLAMPPIATEWRIQSEVGTRFSFWKQMVTGAGATAGAFAYCITSQR